MSRQPDVRAQAKASANRKAVGSALEAEAAAFSRRVSLQALIEIPLLEAISSHGGRASPRQVYDQVADAMALDDTGRSEAKACADGSSYRVFEQQVRWARQTARANGLIAAGSDRGVWELTEQGYEKLGRIRRGVAILVYSVDNGIGLWAHAEDAADQIENGSVKLVMTSPPYPVVDRAYGRYTVPEWLEWMHQLAGIWKRLLTDDGTIALNLMDVFVPGTPALSPYIERFTLAAIDDVGLHLAGRMFWHSPTKLGNIQWTAKAGVRPKNSVEHLLLLSKHPEPAWDINRLDREEFAARSASQLASDRRRGSGVRPGGYDLREDAFARESGGRLPGNLIVAAGASGVDRYSRRCREAGLPLHPARFPPALPRRVIQLTTEPGDVVYDPMSGSNVTGAVASELGRRFIASEPLLPYIQGAALRFDGRPDFRPAGSLLGTSLAS